HFSQNDSIKRIINRIEWLKANVHVESTQTIKDEAIVFHGILGHCAYDILGQEAAHNTAGEGKLAENLRVPTFGGSAVGEATVAIFQLFEKFALQCLQVLHQLVSASFVQYLRKLSVFFVIFIQCQENEKSALCAAA